MCGEFFTVCQSKNKKDETKSLVKQVQKQIKYLVSRVDKNISPDIEDRSEKKL